MTTPAAPLLDATGSNLGPGPAIDPAIRTAYEAAERRYAQLAADIEATGSPCHACRYGSRRRLFSGSDACRHPFTRRGTHDAVSGRLSWGYPRQEEMRRGICGTEGKLFEPAALPLRAVRWAREQAYILIPGALALEAVWIMLAR